MSSTVLEELVKGVKNYNIAVKKRGDDITFLRKIVRGGADDSYGVEVARARGCSERGGRRTPPRRALSDLEATMPKIELRAVAEEDEVPQMTMDSLYRKRGRRTAARASGGYNDPDRGTERAV